jgi:hypothetical protein
MSTIIKTIELDVPVRTSLQLDVEPSDPVEAVGDATGVVERQAEGDLERFKEFIEARRDPTGAGVARCTRATCTRIVSMSRRGVVEQDGAARPV